MAGVSRACISPGRPGPETVEAILAALSLSAGYNAALVAVGAGLLGVAAGMGGSFLVLDRRALVADAMAHATLPGIALAFLAMAALGGEGRALGGLLAGAAATAALGLLLIDWMTRRTRLAEDAAIGAVLSVFYGLGIVLLTVIQTAGLGRPAGLEDFLLGSTSGMLRAEALLIAAGGALIAGLTWALRRPMTLAAFDPDYAAATGWSLLRTRLAMMGLVLAVVLVGLKVVGLVLIVALLVIPAVTARFWTGRVDRLIWIAGGLGGAAGYLGAAISAAAPALPTGPVIVLVAAALFALSLLFAPGRGVLAAIRARRAFRLRLVRREGLVALARTGRVTEPRAQAVLARAGFVHADGAPTEAGRAAAARALLDARRWQTLRMRPDGAALAARHDGLAPLETLLGADEIAELDSRLPPACAPAAGSA